METTVIENPTDYVFKTPPYQHQLAAFARSRDETFFALLMEMGTGKSKVAVDTAGWQFTQGNIDGLLVVAPRSVCGSWVEQQIPSHLPDYVQRKVVQWRGQSKSFERELAGLLKPQPLTLHVLVINPEALITVRGKSFVEKFVNGHNVMMVVDEATMIKNHSAARTKYITRLGKKCKYRRTLTGTPVTNSPLDVWSQFNFLEDGLLGTSSFYAFRNQYAVTRKRVVNGRTFEEVVGFQRLEELMRYVSRYSFRALKKECLDLPEKVYTKRYVELSPTQKKFYETLRDDMVVQLSNGSLVTTQLAITLLLRLQQALCNITTIDGEGEGRTVEIDKDSDPRADAVLDILKEAGNQKVIIWCNFVHTIEKLKSLIADEFGKDSVGAFYGATSDTDRQSLINSFQDPASSLRYLVMQTRTGGFGITLTAATLMIYHDHNWSLEVRQQSEDRAHRIGQKNTVTYVDLVAVDTVDEDIVSALLRKEGLAHQVTGDNLRLMLLAEKEKTKSGEN